MKKEITLSLFIIVLALIEAKARLWSGYAPNLLLVGLVGLSGSIGIIELLFYTLLGFLFLAGPIVSEEILVVVVIVAFVHFLRLFVFGPSPLLTPLFSVAAIFVFYLETVGFTFISNPLFIFEMCLVSVIFGFLSELIIARLREQHS
ncbi:MAG: hypothetical protein AAB903_02965 [Patescibacteria group bacterium]